MNEHDERDGGQDEPQPHAKYPVDDSGRSWAEAARAAHRRTPVQREAERRMLEAFGGGGDE
jgi:hypothetical protein